MKKVILFITFMLVFINHTHSQNLYTPNGMEVTTSAKNLIIEDDNTDYWAIVNGTYEVGLGPVTALTSEPTVDDSAFNCHFYAWHNNQGYI